MNMYVYIKFEKKNCEKKFVYTGTVYWDMKYIYNILIINLKRKKCPFTPPRLRNHLVS